MRRKPERQPADGVHETLPGRALVGGSNIMHYILKRQAMLMTEHAGKSLLKAFGVPVPAGVLIRKSAQVRKWSRGFPIALKAQVASGGRGKAGGVVRAGDSAQAEAAAQQLFGRKFGAEIPASLLVEPWVEHSRELYLAVTVDGESG